MTARSAAPARALTWVICAVLAGLLVATVPAPRARGEQTAAELGLDVQPGFGDGAAATPVGAWVPVTVTVEPERLFAGDLLVGGSSAMSGFTLIEEREVEVAAGSKKVFRFVLPPLDSVIVRAVAPGSEEVAVSAELQRNADGFLVGVLGEIPDGAPSVRSYGNDLRAQYVPVDAAWLDLGPFALDSLGTLVAPDSELARLSDGQKATIADAVAAGLDLTITVAAAGPVDSDAIGLGDLPATAATTDAAGALGLEAAPDAWAATGSQLDARAFGPSEGALVVARRSGRGRVAMVGATLGAEGAGRAPALWSHVLQPGAHLRGGRSDLVGRAVNSSAEALQGGGFGIPSLPWLSVFLVSYVLMVGPINGIVLSRLRRRELAWVTIPALTLVFGVGAFGAASSSQPPIGSSVRAVYWVDGQATEFAAVGVRAPTRGEHQVVLPGQDWRVVASSFRAPSTVNRDDADVRIGMTLEALEVGTLLAWRPTSGTAPLEITAAVTDTGLDVSVVNVGQAALRSLTVTAGSATARIGRLEAGATHDVELGRDELPQLEPWMDDFEGWRGGNGMPELPGAAEALLRYRALDRSPGMVWVTATTEAVAADAVPHADGRATDPTGTLYAVAGSIEPGPALSPFEVSRDVVAIESLGRFDEGMWWAAPHAIESASSVVLRYRLPASDRPLEQLRSTLERGFDAGGMVVGKAQGGNIGVQRIALEGRMKKRFAIGGDERMEVAFVQPAPPPPPPPPPPIDCPPDQVCVQPVPEPRPARPPRPGRATAIEIWDTQAQLWVAIEDAMPNGVGDPRLFVSPLGDVYVRGITQGMFEFSARGIGATYGAAE